MNLFDLHESFGRYKQQFSRRLGINMIGIVLLALALPSVCGDGLCMRDLTVSFYPRYIVANQLYELVENHDVITRKGFGIFNDRADSYLNITRKEPLNNKEYVMVDIYYRLWDKLPFNKTINLFSMLPPAGQTATGNNLKISLSQKGRTVTVTIIHGNDIRSKASVKIDNNGGNVHAGFFVNSLGNVYLTVNDVEETKGGCGKMSNLVYPILIGGPASLGSLSGRVDLVTMSYCLP